MFQREQRGHSHAPRPQQRQVPKWEKTGPGTPRGGKGRRVGAHRLGLSDGDGGEAWLVVHDAAGLVAVHLDPGPHAGRHPVAAAETVRTKLLSHNRIIHNHSIGCC